MNIKQIIKKLFNWLYWQKPVEIDYTARREDMIHMRYDEGKTLLEIGEKYGISRERARQIIGNTGRFFRSDWTKELIKSGKVALNHWTELDDAPGVKREWRKDWGNHRHMAASGVVKTGMEFEERAGIILAQNRINNVLMPNRCDYNIKTEYGLRIEVTVSNVDVSKMPSQNRTVYPMYSVPVRGKENWDFLFAFIPDGDDYTYYVIPRQALEHLKDDDARIRIPHPPMSCKPSKWHRYHKAIYLIYNHEEFRSLYGVKTERSNYVPR